MTNTFRSSASALLAVAMLATFPMAAQADSTSTNETVAASESFETADTRGMDNRQDRRGDRQDCRAAEGAVGGDKRDCKQDSRNG